MKYPEISNVMVGDKTRNIAETGAELVLAGDLGCLMNMAGKASREGRAFRARHVVEVLAGDLGDAGDRRAGVSLHAPTTPAFKANAHAALGDANLQAALRGSRGNFVAEAGQGARRRCPSSTRCATGRATSRTRCSPNLDLYLEAYEAAGGRERRGGALGRDRRGRAARSCSTSAARPGRGRSTRARR